MLGNKSRSRVLAITLIALITFTTTCFSGGYAFAARVKPARFFTESVVAPVVETAASAAPAADSTEDDARQVAAAQGALATVGTLNPVEGTNSSALTMAQDIVDRVASGVEVIIYGSSNSQVADTGLISYGNAPVSGYVYYKLTKNNAVRTREVTVAVPSHATSDNPQNEDASQVADAKAALAAAGTLRPVAGTDSSVLTMAQAIVNQASTGVTVRITSSANSRVATTGTITYGTTAVTGNVTFSLTNNSASATQVVPVAVPAQANTDADQVASAKAALATAGTLRPVAGTDSSVLPMAQAIVNKASTGVTVRITSSANGQVATTGTITYGTTAVTGNVTFSLTKNSVSATQAVPVAVPAQTSTDADQVASAKAALAAAGTLRPVSGTDSSVLTMAQAIVNKASAGVTVKITSSANAQVATTGTITYGTTAVTGNVTFGLTKNSASATQAVPVTVPAQVSTGMVSVKNFGAVGNGTTDDSTAIQNAANDAKTKGSTLYIPAGNYLITKDVKIYSSVECQGKLVIRNSSNTPTIYIGWSKPSVTLSASTLSGLTKGSTRISGLKGYKGGTVVLESSEVLIQRNPSGSYTKMETSEITSDDGQISPALDNTYSNLSQLSAVVHPYEAPIVVNGLTVEAGGAVTTNQSLVECYRDNITFNDLSLVNDGACNVSAMNVGLTLRGCGITLNSPVITGFSTLNQMGNGYGIMYGKTSFLTINDAYITDCNGHAIAGYNDKEIRINGGYFSHTVDEHWGSNMVIDGATIEGFVDYAGTNITIRNCTYVDCTRMLVVRSDTPELMGKVIIDNIVIKNSATSGSIWGFGYSQSRITTNYGRTLKAPDLVSITNVKVNLPSTGTLNLMGTANASAWITNPVDPIKQIYTNNITAVNNVGKIVLGY